MPVCCRLVIYTLPLCFKEEFSWAESLSFCSFLLAHCVFTVSKEDRTLTRVFSYLLMGSRKKAVEVRWQSGAWLLVSGPNGHLLAVGS